MHQARVVGKDAFKRVLGEIAVDAQNRLNNSKAGQTMNNQTSTCDGGMSRFSTLLRRLVWLSLFSMALPVESVPLCRWVDANGRTQMAEVVPSQYLRSAKCEDSARYQLSADKQEQARQQSLKLRQQADDKTPPPSASAPSSAVPARAAASLPAKKRPSQGVDESTDCATWRRLYQESAACFAPYNTARGGVKAEAFEKCKPIPSPDVKCGPAAN